MRGTREPDGGYVSFDDVWDKNGTNCSSSLFSVAVDDGRDQDRPRVLLSYAIRLDF